MLPLPLSSRSTVPLEISSFNEKNCSAGCQTCSSHNTKSKASVPVFAEEDKILMQLQELGICDEKFNPLPQFENLLFPVLSSSSLEDQSILKSIHDFFTKDLHAEGEPNDHVDPFTIEFTFQKLFRFLCKKSQSLFKDSYVQHEGDLDKVKSTFIEIEGIFPIEEAALIGLYLIEILGKNFCVRFCKELFLSHISPECIEEWFRLPHIHESFNQKAKKMCMKIYSKGPLRYQRFLSTQAQNFLIERMKNFDQVKYCEFLKTKESRYANRDPSDKLLKQDCFQACGEITKRKVVDDNATKYVIFGNKTDDRPFELTFVQSDSDCANLHLETPELSSRDCFSCNLIPFLKNDNSQTDLTIKTEGFSPAKAMIDLLTNSISTDASHNVWFHNLKDYKRYTIQEMESAGIRCFFSHNKSESSKSAYFVSKLEEELKKESITDPFLVLQYLLRASLSIYEHSQMSEDEISEFWQLAGEKYLNFDPTDKSHAFGIALKKALIAQQLPFSIVYAWIGMIGFLDFPTSFTRLGWTDKGPTHAFELKYPFCLRVAAVPKSQCQAVFAFLQKSPEYLPELIQICKSLESHSESTVHPHPLQECFTLNFDTFFKEEWLSHSDATLNDFGMKLYLIAAGEGITHSQIDTLFYYLPRISKEHLRAIETLVERLPEYHDALDLFKEKSPNTTEKFIEVLINSKQKSLAQLALRLWRKSPPSKEINWLIFNALTVFSPQEALRLLQTMAQEGQLKVTEKCKGFLLLLDRSQKNLEIPFEFDELIPFFKLIVNSAVDISTEDKTKIDKKIYPILKSQCALLDEELLLKVSQVSIFEPENLEDLWLTWLERKLEVVPVKNLGILFYTLEERKYVKDGSKWQELKVRLGTCLLQEKENALTQKLLGELITSSTTLASLFDLISQFLTLELIQPRKELVPLLKYLVDTTPDDKVEMTTGLIKLLCKNAVDPFLLPLIEELLAHPKTITLLEKDPEGHIPLLKIIEATSTQPIGPLETRKALFLSKESKKLLSNHKDLVKESAKKEIEKFLTASKVDEKDLSFILDLFEFYYIFDENLWLKFLGILEKNGSKKIQEGSCALFKKIESEFPTQLIRAQCWVLYLKSLRKIDHTDILSYFDSLEALKGIFLESGIEKKLAYREILLAQIARFSANSFDQNHYEKIIKCYQDLGKEDASIENALIMSVHTPSQKTFFQEACARLTKIIASFHENKEAYGPFVEVIEGVFVDGYQDKFKEEVSGLIQAILSQKEYPQHSCVRILSFLEKSTIPIAFSLFERVVEDKKLLGQLKSPFLSLFPLSLKQDSLNKIKEREAQLDVALKVLSLEPREIANLVDALLSRISSLCCNEKAIDAVEAFSKWSMYFFMYPEILKKHVKTIIQVSLSYADPERSDLQNQEKFSKCVQDVISIRYKMPIDTSKCKMSCTAYLKWCMQCWKESKMKEEFFVVAMDKLISNHIQEYGKETSVTSLDILEELEEFAFFWAIAPINCIGTPYLLFEEKQRDIAFDLLKRLQALTLEADENNIFVNHPSKLAKLWLYLQISDEEQLELPPNDVYRAACELISKLLDFPISSQVLFSIILLNQWDDVNDEKHFKVFLKQIEQIVPKCLIFPFAVYMNESLLKIIYNKTLKDVKICITLRPLLLPLPKLLLDSAWNMYEQAKKSNLVQYQIHYLELCMEVLKRHLAVQGKNRDYKNFDQWLRKFIPEIISLEQQEWVFDCDNPLIICKKNGLIKKFFGLIREFENPHVPSNDKEKRIGKTLIISFLDGLMAKNHFELTCTALAIINKANSIFTPNDRSCLECFGRFEKWLPQGPDFQPTDLEIIEIKFHSKNLLNDYPSYLKRVEKLFKDLSDTDHVFNIRSTLNCIGDMFAESPVIQSEENFTLQEQFYNEFFQTLKLGFADVAQEAVEMTQTILNDLHEIAEKAGIKIIETELISAL